MEPRKPNDNSKIRPQKEGTNGKLKEGKVNERNENEKKGGGDKLVRTRKEWKGKLRKTKRGKYKKELKEKPSIRGN